VPGRRQWARIIVATELIGLRIEQSFLPQVTDSAGLPIRS